MRSKFYYLLIALLFVSSFAQAQHIKGKPIRVLIVDGFNNHDWKQTSLVTKAILEESGRFVVSVSTMPPTVGDSSWDAWNPQFENYAVVIQNTNNIQTPAMYWPLKVRQHLEAYVKNGGGLFVLHSANNAFPDWPEYNKMIGLGWRSKDTGFALQLDSNDHVKRIPPGEGEGTNHGERFNAVIHIVNRHPINKGFPAEWKTSTTEVYRFARGPAENITILSAATDSVTHKIWPVEWIVKYGKGNMYTSSMGHLWTGEIYPPNYRCIGFQTTLIRAVEWLATGKVSYPVPSNFPTKNKTSLRSEKDFPGGGR